MGPVSFERWKPYQTWWSSLQPGQTIISFNYDLVIERLASEDTGKLVVVMPQTEVPGACNPGKAVRLIKLHGSVNWRRLPEAASPDRCRLQSDDFAITCEDEELAIASPGLTKQRMVKDDFSSLWVHAEAALRAAKAIVFVGYRFPPTDSEALARLLAAIGANESPYLALHTVLGSTRGDDERRLHSLLRYAARVKGRKHTSRVGMDALDGMGQGGLRLYTLVSQGLWAQDFLLVAQQHELLQPYLVNWE